MAKPSRGRRRFQPHEVAGIESVGGGVAGLPAWFCRFIAISVILCRIIPLSSSAFFENRTRIKLGLIARSDSIRLLACFDQFKPKSQEPILKSALVESTKFDIDNVLFDKEAIGKVNPHRFELSLLDGILYMEDDHAVGFKDITQEEFWVRGHFPEKPIMPGVLICECAAQLSSYFARQNNLVEPGCYVGLGGLENVRFRGPVVPGDRLIMMLKRGRVRRNVIFTAEFQGWVGETLVVDGAVKGIVLND